MKVLYCEKCHDLFKLTRKEFRECKCGRVKGKYRTKKYAEVSNSAVSIKIPNGSIKKAIGRMKRLKQEKPKSKDKDYRGYSAIPAWVRPNNGPGNPHTEPLKKDTRTSKAR
jgi:hypothetical protein